MKAWAESEVQAHNQSCIWRELDHLEPTFVQTKVQFERLKGAVQRRRIRSYFDWGLQPSQCAIAYWAGDMMTSIVTNRQKMPVDTKKPAKKVVAKSATVKSTFAKSTRKSNGKPQVLNKGTKKLSTNLKHVEALAEVPSTEAVPNPELPTEWEAEEITWTKLRVDRNKRAWVLAALSVGAKPFKDLRKRLKNAGQTEKLHAYVIARSAALNNLTSTNDSTRLQYVKDAENDGRLINPAAKATERMVDMLEFVKFMDSRGLPVHDRMRAIAAEFGGGPETHNRPSDSIGMTHTTEPLAGSREMLAMALLMMYVKHLAQTKTTPPQKLLKGQGNLKLSELASEIHQFAEGRTDQVTANALASTGASPETLRKGLAAAQKFFHDSFVD